MAEQLAPTNGGGSIPTSPIQFSKKSHQRIIREQHALERDPLIGEKMFLARSLKNAVVRQIDRETAKAIILKYEWLGTMGTTDFQFGLYFGEHLAGVVCFGRTAGTKTAESVCGREYAHRVKVLNRGACVHWAHPQSASFLDSVACKLMAKKGYNIFIGYSDPAANEFGTIYQAMGWLYCGTTQSQSSGFVWSGKPILKDRIWGTFKDGKIHDERNIQHCVRCRSFSDPNAPTYQVKCSRREKHQQMIDEGFLFVSASPKGRYVGLYGDRETVESLRAALKWEKRDYPKRANHRVAA